MNWQQLAKTYQTVINKPPSAGLWEGQADQEELGLTYDQIDRYLASGEASAALKKRLEAIIASNKHKCQPPLVADFLGGG